MKRRIENEVLAMRKSLITLFAGAVLALPLAACNENVETEFGMAEEEEEIAPVETLDADTIAQVIRGGALYGNWITEAETTVPGAPATDPTTGMYILMLDHADLTGIPTVTNATRFNNSGATTYRCKTCHGWDYKGVDGQYGDPSSSNYTGFIGILDAQSKYTVEELEAIIGDGIPHPDNPDLAAHAFGAWLDPEDITALAMFVKYGLLDPDQYLWSFSGWVRADKGDPVRGQALYEGREADCATCHGDDGTAIDFGGGEYVGTIGIENPWEMIHTIRFGHAGPETPTMPALYENGALTTQDAIDITAYTQTLPLAP